MVREGGPLEDVHGICDCGRKPIKSSLAQHIRLFCPEKQTDFEQTAYSPGAESRKIYIWLAPREFQRNVQHDKKG